jgi:hypothetical protein
MVSTVFPMFAPVTDRLIAVNAPSLMSVLPRIEGNPMLPVVEFAAADLIVATLTLHRMPAWNAFGAWFVGLPL